MDRFSERNGTMEQDIKEPVRTRARAFHFKWNRNGTDGTEYINLLRSYRYVLYIGFRKTYEKRRVKGARPTRAVGLVSAYWGGWKINSSYLY